MRRVGRALGMVAYYVGWRHRRLVMDNLTQAFGKVFSLAELHRLARRVYGNMGITLMEFLRLPGWSSERINQIVSIDGEEHLREALRQGRGVILLTAHYGNWELIGAKLVARGYPLHVIVRDQADDAITDLLTRIRAGKGLRLIRREQAPREVLRALRRNEPVAILADQNGGPQGQFVEFFGKLASTPAGPAAFALQTGAPVVPGFGIRHDDGTHTVRFYPPIPLVRTGDRHHDLHENTQNYTREIEARIRERPDHWHWMNKRWRTYSSPPARPQTTAPAASSCSNPPASSSSN